MNQQGASSWDALDSSRRPDQREHSGTQAPVISLHLCQTQEWLEGGAKSPKEAVMKERLRELLL